MVRRVIRWAGIALLVIGYPLLAHFANASADNSRLGAVVAIAPLILIAVLLARRSRWRVIMMGMLGMLCVALWIGWGALEHHFGLVFWIQHVGIQLMLLVTFGRTLLAGRQSLCTRFAHAVHAPLTPRHEIYSRQVTVAWTLFFAAMALVSTLLFFLTPLATWSVFANFLTLPLVVLMFIAEYWVRRWVLPDMKKKSIFDAVRAFRSGYGSPR